MRRGDLSILMDATPVVERLRRELPPELGPLRDLDFTTKL
jgi:hypothetical protein